MAACPPGIHPAVFRVGRSGCPRPQDAAATWPAPGRAPAPPAASRDRVPAAADASSHPHLPGIPVPLQGPSGAGPHLPRAALRPQLRDAHRAGLPLPASPAGARLRHPRPPGPAPPPAAAAPHVEPWTSPTPRVQRRRADRTPPRWGGAALRLGVTSEALPSPGRPLNPRGPTKWPQAGELNLWVQVRRGRSARSGREMALDSLETVGAGQPFPTPRGHCCCGGAGKASRRRDGSQKGGLPGFCHCGCPGLLPPHEGQPPRARCLVSQGPPARFRDFHTH